MKHTKGNWIVKPQIEKKKHASMFYVYSDGGKCNECGREIDGRHICVTLESATGMEQAKANAKLIAAAPELLNACIESLSALKSGYIEQRAKVTELILIAIKKATE